MRCIIKSWRCEYCESEVFQCKPKDKHFFAGKMCKGIWKEYDWRRQLKPIEKGENGK